MIPPQSGLSRRGFLATVARAGAVLMLKPGRASAAGDLDPRVAEIVASTIGIDTHNHVDVPLSAAEVPGPNLDLAGEMKRSGLSAICMTFAVDRPQLREPGDGYARFNAALDSMDRQLELNGMKRSLSLAELRAAHAQGRPTVVQAVEGGHFLEGRIERLEEAYKRGLRHFGLLHDEDASVPLGDIYTKPPRFGGLTPFGAAVIKEANRLGMLVDLAHANAEMVADALKIASKPVLISHTGLDSRMGQNPSKGGMMRPRLISKEQAKIVADAGGVIGVWTHLADTPLEYAENVRALVDVVGIDHVCIGTDTKMTPGGGFQGGGRGPAGGPRPDNPNGPREGGAVVNPGAAKKGPPQGRGGGTTNQAWPNQTAGFYHSVVAAMLKTGFTPTEIALLGGGNFCRVFEAATAGRG